MLSEERGFFRCAPDADVEEYSNIPPVCRIDKSLDHQQGLIVIPAPSQFRPDGLRTEVSIAIHPLVVTVIDGTNPQSVHSHFGVVIENSYRRVECSFRGHRLNTNFSHDQRFHPIRSRLFHQDAVIMNNLGYEIAVVDSDRIRCISRNISYCPGGPRRARLACIWREKIQGSVSRFSES